MTTAPILVVGRSGRVARALLEEAGKHEVALRALGRPDLDIEDSDSIKRMLAAVAPRAIVNCAGLVVVDDAERDPDRAFRINRDGAANLARAAGDFNIPLVHLSSDYVFDGSKGAPYREDDPPNPISVYGRSKAAGEAAVLTAYPAAIVVRTSWIYGAHAPNFITTMLGLAEKHESVRVVADQRGSPTLDTDLAQALIEIVTQRQGSAVGSEGGIYHVAGSGETTWFGLAEALFAAWARCGRHVPRLEQIPLAEWIGLAKRPRDSRLDCRKAERAFGIRLPNWRVSLERFVEDLAHARSERI
jgi:dTDP-4-dehydrorhamnose reductase